VKPSDMIVRWHPYRWVNLAELQLFLDLIAGQKNMCFVGRQ
jgi:hypothetical protein